MCLLFSPYGFGMFWDQYKHPLKLKPPMFFKVFAYFVDGVLHPSAGVFVAYIMYINVYIYIHTHTYDIHIHIYTHVCSVCVRVKIYMYGTNMYYTQRYKPRAGYSPSRSILGLLVGKGLVCSS